MKKRISLAIAAAAVTVLSTAGQSDTSNTTARTAVKPHTKTIMVRRVKKHQATPKHPQGSQHNRHNPAALSPAITTTPMAQHWFLDHISGNFGLYTNYMFRGISQTSDLPSAQGGLVLTTDPGIYLSLWGSNVDFVDLRSSTATTEFDYILGAKHAFTCGLGYDVSITHYSYPKATAANYNELIGVFTYKIIALLVGYSTNVFGYHATGTYVNLGLNVPMPPQIVYFNNVTISGGVGHYTLPSAAGNGYTDYNIQIAKTFDKYVFAVQWTDTNGALNLHPYDQSKIVGSVTANF